MGPFRKLCVHPTGMFLLLRTTEDSTLLEDKYDLERAFYIGETRFESFITKKS